MEKIKKIYFMIKKRWSKIISIVLALVAAVSALGFVKPELAKNFTKKFLEITKVIENVDEVINE